MRDEIRGTSERGGHIVDNHGKHERLAVSKSEWITHHKWHSKSKHSETRVKRQKDSERSRYSRSIPHDKN